MGAPFRQLIIYPTQYHTELREELQSIRTSIANWHGVRSLGMALRTACLIIPLTTGKDIDLGINDEVMGAIVLDHDATVISAVALRSAQLNRSSGNQGRPVSRMLPLRCKPQRHWRIQFLYSLLNV